MQALSKSRRLVRVLRLSTLNSDRRFRSSHAPVFVSPIFNHQCEIRTPFNGSIQGNLYTQMAYFSAESSHVEERLAVKDLYDKIIESVNVKQTMSPNAWLWSLIEKCKNQKDIELLFHALKTLRNFRLSHLRIHENFNCALCRDIAKACARVGALEFGKKTLWLHNVYGLAPSVASANHLLNYAKTHKDIKLMDDVMKLMKLNDLPWQPSTADLVFSICHDMDKWELLAKYSQMFIKAGVKLRVTTFEKWMQFAALRGDTESLWKIEELRAGSMKQHSLATGFSCAKGFLLERKPRDAATIIQLLNQTLSDKKKQGIVVELEKLVNEWPIDVIKCRKDDDQMAIAASLNPVIPAMVSELQNMGSEDLTTKQSFLS